MLIDEDFDQDEPIHIHKQRCVFPVLDKHGLHEHSVASRKRPTMRTEAETPETFDLPDEPPPGWAEV